MELVAVEVEFLTYQADILGVALIGVQIIVEMIKAGEVNGAAKPDQILANFEKFFIF